MRVTRLSLTDFRNYASAELELSAGPTVLVGRNGQGKTNLVESIVYLSTLSSHRTSDDHAMIREGADAAVVRARLAHEERGVLVELQLNRRGANRAQVNRSSLKPRELPRYVSSVVFAPEDLALVRGDPGGRRRLLDALLVMRAPRLAGVLADYDRVLRQRTSLLKSVRGVRGGDPSGTLEIWDERLVELGSEILAARLALVAELVAPVRAAYASVSGGDDPVSLVPRLSITGAAAEDEEAAGAGGADTPPPAADELVDVFRRALAAARPRELERGLTLVGPHRDDLVLRLNGLPAKGYASHGESWSLALALRLASAELLRSESPLGDPVVVLDDVFAELDVHRRASLASAVADYEQVLVTAAVAEDVPASLAGRTVGIRAGRILDEHEHEHEHEHERRSDPETVDDGDRAGTAPGA